VAAVCVLAALGAACGTVGTPAASDESDTPVSIWETRSPSAAFTVSGTLVSPAAGSRVRGVIKLAARARADHRVGWVDFLVDGVVVASDSARPYRAWWDSSVIPAGSHDLTVAVWDAWGRRSLSDPVRVKTDGVRRHEVSAKGRSLASAIAALGSNGGTVYLPEGTWSAANVKIGSNVHLFGSGPKTVIRAPEGSNYGSILSISGRDVSIHDLVVDGNGGAQSEGSGWAVEVHGTSADVLLSQLRIVDVHVAGVYLWGQHRRVSLQDSFIDGARRAGSGVHDQITDFKSGDTSVLRSKIQHVRDHGIAFFPWTPEKRYPGPRALAYGNTILDVTNPDTNNGTNEGGIWSGGHDALLIDNVIDGTGWTAIETFGNARRNRILDNKLRNSGVGVYVEHETYDTLIQGNDIRKVSKVGIAVEWWYGGGGSKRITMRENRISGAGSNGIFVDVGSTHNVIENNTILDSGDDAIELQGSSSNLVRNNDLRDTAPRRTQDYCVREDNGRWDDGALATPDRNTITSNDCRGSRKGSVRKLGAATTAEDNRWP